MDTVVVVDPCLFPPPAKLIAAVALCLIESLVGFFTDMRGRVAMENIAPIIRVFVSVP